MVFIVLSIFSAALVYLGLFGKIPSTTLSRVQELVPFVVPVVVFSGSVVIGNAILTALGHANRVVMLQLIVPLICIVMIYFFSHSIGAKAAIIGLVVGQLINFWLIKQFSNGIGFSLLPKTGNLYWKKWLGQYTPLVGAAALTSASIPVGIFMASHLPDGSVAAFSLGAKVLQSVTTLVSAVFIAIVLPYFARLLSENRTAEAKNTLQILISTGVVLAIPLSFIFFIYADVVAGILFFGGKVVEADVQHLASVMKFGALQFPFYIVLVILIKYALARQETIFVFVVAIFGQIANLCASYFLIDSFSTAGLAIAMTLGIAVSAFGLLIWASLRKYVDPFLVALVVIAWILFFTLIICISYGSILGVLICIVALIVLLAGEVSVSNKGLARFC
jgi:peptidoglycan biosynthesis protein MviN/MurJ (putative lipid II flippase)